MKIQKQKCCLFLNVPAPQWKQFQTDVSSRAECNLVEGEDHVEVNGEVFPKPFVEKPVCAEDHNVYIYYPTSAGGGSQRLFRKVADQRRKTSPSTFLINSVSQYRRSPLNLFYGNASETAGHEWHKVLLGKHNGSNDGRFFVSVL